MIIGLDGEGLESPLIDRAGPGAFPCEMPASTMSRCKPLHEAGQLAVGRWADDQVEVVGHQTVGKQVNRVTLASRTKNLKARLIRLVGVKQLPAANAAIDDVKGNSPGPLCATSVNHEHRMLQT
jgi:hypothetical protein